MQRTTAAVLFATALTATAASAQLPNASSLPPTPAAAATFPDDDTTDVVRPTADGVTNTDTGRMAVRPATGDPVFKSPNAASQHDISPEVAALPDGDKVVCRDMPVIGSRLFSHLCFTKRKWKQMHDDGRAFMQNAYDRSSQGGVHPFGP